MRRTRDILRHLGRVALMVGLFISLVWLIFVHLDELASQFGHSDRVLELHQRDNAWFLGETILLFAFICAMETLNWRKCKSASANPDAAPNGHPATPGGNSGLREGPPSVNRNAGAEE